ncbi:hypothetical protein C2134_17055 [Chromobacterium sinusclupearum]|uniref:FAD/NAD(P)-binding domain-containing protein n=1 Tax=Chromobacterium sinusclupearum TaxID=2077146 RepID=A0A2K4MKB4_9NEIS|nr:FAD-dependent oxidoreductase [Chromobacterium sinusclupearum]POA97534.1 hypothetical protein C2134_17055 [Chromobacterium sinusclupearum]
MARSQPRILILGGGYAGLHLARLCATHFSRIASITLIDASDHWCERIRFHQLAAGQELPRYAYAQILSSLNVEFVQAQVESIQPKERSVTARSSNGNLQAIDYDYLVLALGSRIVAPPGLQSMLTLNDAAQAEIIHDRLKAISKPKVLLVGAGLSGLECAFELAETYPEARITLADSGRLRPMNQPGGFSREAIQYLQAAAERLGIDWRSDSRAIASGNEVVTFADGTTEAFDLCVLTAGFRPSPLISAAGLEVDERGCALVETDLSCKGYPEVLAIGDCAAISTASSGPLRMSCAAALPAAMGAVNTLVARLNGELAPEFAFHYVFRNVSIGRHDGLIQFVSSHDIPMSEIWTGRKAAEWKDFICKCTVAELGLGEEPLMPHEPPQNIFPGLLAMQKLYETPRRSGEMRTEHGFTTG